MKRDYLLRLSAANLQTLYLPIVRYHKEAAQSGIPASRLILAVDW